MSGKGGSRGNPPKKPSAIIDLKATEVRASSSDKKTDPKASDAAKSAGQSTATGRDTAGAPTGTAEALKAGRPATSTPAVGAKPVGGADAKSPTAKSTTASSATGAKTAAAATAAAATGTAAAAKTSATSSSSRSDGKAADATTSGKTGGTGGGGGRTPPPQPAPRKGGGGILSTLSHLVAAVVGGAFVLFFGEELAQKAGVPLPQRTVQLPPEVTTRLAALEQAAAKPATVTAEALPADVSQKLATIDQQSQTIQTLQSELAALQAAQTELKETAATAATSATGTAEPAKLSDEDAARIAKLERTIETLSQAAGKDGTGGGRIAQLASVSGKLADLETTLQTQLSTLRQSVMSDIDKRLAPTAQASEAARSGTQRVDRELAETKAEVARVAQRTEAISATADRLDEALRAVREETGRLTSELAAVQTDVKDQFAAVAKPSDVENAVAPISEKVTALETGLEQVVSKEQARQQDAERVVLALQLANLKRALERGGSFETELAEVKAAAGEKVDLSALEPYQADGVATSGRLSAEFRAMSHDLITAAETNPNASWMDQMLAGAKSVVRVRRTGETVGVDPNSAEAVVAKIEAALAKGDLVAASTAADLLPGKAKETAGGWLKSLKARASVDQAIAAIEGDLKSSIAGESQSADPEKKS